MKGTFEYKDYSGAYIGRLEAAIAATMPEVAAALEAEGKNAAQSMIYATPESPSYKRTGNLLASITHESTRDSATARADTDYAFYVHEGTKKMTARPFLRVALDKEIAGFLDRLRRRI